MGIMMAMNHKIHKVLALLAMTSIASASHQMLKAVAMVESSNNPQAVGDSGKARGLYQMHEPAWKQVSIERAKAGLKVWSWAYAHDPYVSGIYAEAYLKWLSNGLEKRLGRKPAEWEVYAAYNRGLQGFANLGYDFSCLPNHTKRACQKIALYTQSSIPNR
jgi:membrane-bound lytic murein transglycosylase MltF